ncbi:MAG TPA: response regulator transcription factor [Cyclobacteriaceae bacterium]|nr:response regulator transcription factor [Cyclobacteriaceae bacterium]
MDGSFKIVIIEDNEVVRESLRLLVRGLGEYEIAGAYDSCENAFKRLEKDLPNLILMDMELPGMNGIEGIQYVKQRHPEIDVLMLTVHDDSQLVFDALVAGASGYITKNSPHNKILDAIDEIRKGGAPMSSNIARMVVESFQRNLNSPLSRRETEVLELLASGKSYSVIADELFIHRETVKTHIKNIYIKLQVNSKAAAIEFARKNRLI